MNVRAPRVPSTTAALGGALVFGIAAGWLKGDGADVRSALGNLSAPWLLIAVLPAWGCRTWWRGAVTGLTSTLLGLLGFYLAMTAVTYHHLGFTSGYPHALRFVLRANRTWFVAGVLSGPVCGAATVRLRRLRAHVSLLGVTAALMVGEFVVVRAISSRPLAALDQHLPAVWTWNVGDWRAYDAELSAGLILAALAVALRMRGVGRAPH